MRVPTALAAVALALLASSARAQPGADADADGDGVRFHGAAQLRAVAERNLPGTAVRYDPARGAFALSDYLAPRGDGSHGSLLASLGLEGLHLAGGLRWVITADTGELRRERSHAVGRVCWSDATDSGLAAPGSPECGLYRLTRLVWSRVTVPVEETAREREAKITSNGRPLGEEVKHTLLLREAYASYRFGRAGFLALSAGRRRTAVGDGYVHDDYATGVQLDADLGAIGPPWYLSAAVFQPTRDLPRAADAVSPMFALRVEYLPSLFDHAGLFAAGLRERGESLAGVYRGAVVERLVVAAERSEPGTALHRRASQLLAAASAATLRGDATLGWLGTSGKLTVARGHRLSWTAALLGGKVRRVDAGGRATTVAEELDLRGQLAVARWDAELAPTLSAGAEVIFLSGGTLPRAGLDAEGRLRPATGLYRAFMGVSPYLAETSIFFGGGLSEGYADRQVRTPGVNGRGVVAPILSLRWDPAARLTARARGAWLRAAEAGPFGGHQYGTELDLDLSWEATRWLVLGAEADALLPGDFFRGRAPITRAILAVDVLTP